MYSPPHFAQTDIEAIHTLIENNPFATLITLGDDGVCANHIPLHLTKSIEPYGILSGHIPRANPLWRETAALDGLAIFHGADAYITPSWYATKQESGKVVPTWNYTVVHARGRIRFIDDADWVRHHLEVFTNQLEAQFEHPWAVADAPADFVANLLRHLIGIEIVIDKLEGKWKLSQNRSGQDRAGVIRGLRGVGTERADEMAQLIQELYS